MTQNVDFLPEDYVERRNQQRSAVLFVGLFVAVMVGIIAAYMVGQSGPRKALAERDRVNQLYEDAAKRLAQRQELEREQQRMMAKAEVTAVLMERVPRSRLLLEITNLMPKGVSLITLDLKSRELQNTPANTRMDQAKAESKPEARPAQWEVTINLTGVAPTDDQVASFIAALGKSSTLSDVNLLFSEEFKRPGQDKDKDRLMRRFKVEMKISPNADLTSTGEPENKQS